MNTWWKGKSVCSRIFTAGASGESEAEILSADVFRHGRLF